MYWPFSVPTSVRAHLPFLPLLSHSLSLSLSLSQSRRRMGWGGGGQLEHRRLFVWDFFIWFPSSLHTERTHYAIIYFHIQRRDVEGPVGPRSVLSPLLCFILDPFPNRAHPGRKKKSKERVKSMQEKCQAGFSSKLQEFLDALLTCLQILKVKGTDFCLRYANIKTPQSFLPQTSRFLTIVTLHSYLMYSTRHLAFSSGMLILRLWTCTPYRQRFTYSKDPSSTIKCQ